MLGDQEEPAKLDGNKSLTYPFPLIPAAFQGVLWLYLDCHSEDQVQLRIQNHLCMAHAKITELINRIQTNICWSEL